MSNSILSGSVIFPNADLSEISRMSHPIFQRVEKHFWEWIESSHPAAEYREKYFGDDAIYTKRGAIEQAIEAALDEANEEKKPVRLSEFDFDAIFGD